MADTTKLKRRRSATNYTLSRQARRLAKQLLKPLDKRSESALVETLILNEASRLGLLKIEATQPKELAA